MIVAIEKPKPCPFCGNANIKYHYEGSSHWSFECDAPGCYASVVFWMQEDHDDEHKGAVTRWNRRVVAA